MRLIAAIIGLLVLGGCSMSGPGIARIQPQPAPGTLQKTTYNSDWVSRPKDPVDSLDTMGATQLSVDLSKRELGANYLDPEVREGRYVDAAEKRQMERQAARKAAWRARMGLTNIKDEQEAREAGSKPANKTGSTQGSASSAKTAANAGK
ncbi:MAG: hypothetical protein IT463_00705 [Planctomycetes bacterium]|nr:hypothetical protein [Planctomycetota bacterium]